MRKSLTVYAALFKKGLSWDEAKAFIVIIGYLKLPRGELKPDTIRYPDMFIQ